MSRLATFLIIPWLLSGCFEAETPAALPPVLPDSSFIEDIPSTDAKDTTSDKRIVVVADPWCPHNCKAGAAQEGYMVDIAREALAYAGYTLEYQNFSWARALRMARRGQFHAVVGAFRTDAPDFIFPEIAQGRASISLFTHPDKDWTYEGIASLESQTLLAINGYSYTAELDNYIDRNKDNRQRIWILSGPEPFSRALNLLEIQRTDVFAADDYVVAWAVRNKPDLKRPRRAGQVMETLSYVAFSPANENSPQLARLLSEGTQKLIDNGRMKAILENYGLTGLPEMP
jgi:polar amino acid transport system substrate-binding protein